MSLQSKYLKSLGESNPEKFNENFLTLKIRDDESKYLEASMKTLNSIEGIEYLYMEQVPHKIFMDVQPEDIEDSKLSIDIDKSRLKLYRFYFKISKGDREEVMSMEIFYPELVRGQFFLINNNRYFPVFQLLDSSFFNTKRAVVLKTLIMPIVLEHKSDNLILNIFKKKISPFYYYFAKMGYTETIKYFGLEDNICVLDNIKDVETLLTLNDDIDWEVFEISKKFYLCIESKDYKEKELIYNSIRECFNTRTKIDKLDDLNVWKKKLGTLFSNTPDKIRKANSTLVSFERGLDDLTKELLRLPSKDKEDIYSIIRYMMLNYDYLKHRDNRDLANKRIRSHEYLIYPLLKRFTNFVRRINNSRKVSFERLQDFKPTSKGYLIQCAVSNELLRYDSSCNSINIISKLKLSQSGMQSQFSTGAVSIEYRANHESYMGRIGLLATSAGNPGCTGTFTPFCDLVDLNHFTDKES